MILMRIPANSVSEYISKVPEDRRESFEKILEILRNNLPEGFQECLGYGMPAFAVPHSLYPDGYHCKPEEPLPFISVAINFIGFTTWESMRCQDLRMVRQRISKTLQVQARHGKELS